MYYIYSLGTGNSSKPQACGSTSQRFTSENFMVLLTLWGLLFLTGFISSLFLNIFQRRYSLISSTRGTEYTRMEVDRPSGHRIKIMVGRWKMVIISILVSSLISTELFFIHLSLYLSPLPKRVDC